jgi:hypothetical protein
LAFQFGGTAQNEIFDMIRPADGIHITLQDLLNSNNADLFCAILTDVNAFYLCVL